MIEEYKDRIQKAKERPYMTLNNFNIGDIVYPFFAHNLVNWGTVVDINPITRKITVNFNGVNRQFDPQWLMKTNPQIKIASRNRIASNYYKMVQAVYYKESPGLYKISNDQKQSGEMICPKCKSPMKVNFNVQQKQAQFVCEECSKKITKSNVVAMIKKEAGFMGDLCSCIEEFAFDMKQKKIKKRSVLKNLKEYSPEYRELLNSYGKQLLPQIVEELKNNDIQVQ